MARLRNIVHSNDACTMIFEGDKATPEPTMGAIKFPGGYIEVSRCSDGSYYVHMSREAGHTKILDSRIDYDHEAYQRNGIGDVPDADDVIHIAMKIGRS